jgi:hypothetical protein
MVKEFSGAIHVAAHILKDSVDDRTCAVLLVTDASAPIAFQFRPGSTTADDQHDWPVRNEGLQ